MKKLIAIILLLSVSGCLSPAFAYSQFQTEKLAELEIVFLTLKNELNQLQSSYESQKITLSELRSELESRAKLLNDYEQGITSLQFSLIESESDTQNLREQLAAVRAQLAEVQSLLSEALESLENYNKQALKTNIIVGAVSIITGLIIGIIAE